METVRGRWWQYIHHFFNHGNVFSSEDVSVRAMSFWYNAQFKITHPKMTICLISIFCAFMMSDQLWRWSLWSIRKKTILPHHLLKSRLNKMIITQSSSAIVAGSNNKLKIHQLSKLTVHLYLLMTLNNYNIFYLTCHLIRYTAWSVDPFECFLTKMFRMSWEMANEISHLLFFLMWIQTFVGLSQSKNYYLLCCSPRPCTLYY